MKLRDYILYLEQIEKEHGNLDVNSYGYSGRRDTPMPSLKFCKILKGRESKPDYWNEWEGEERKGKMVVHV